MLSKRVELRLFSVFFFSRNHYPPSLSYFRGTAIHSLDIFLKVIKHPELPVGDAGHLAPVGLRVVVEVPRVAIVTNFGHDGRLQLFVVNLLPVNILEPSGK